MPPKASKRGKSAAASAQSRPGSDQGLFDRVAAILEEARGNVVRAVNTNMVWAYWLIGREMVNELQGGEARAEYGKRVIEDLSKRLTERYGRGFSDRNLQWFKQFYLAYRVQDPILHPPGAEFGLRDKAHPSGAEIGALAQGAPPARDGIPAFSPQLTWSHYRALTRVENRAARDFYEREAIECGWSKAQLERQIHSYYYDRILANRGEPGRQSHGRERLPGEPVNPAHLLKSPMVLEFLGLPESPELHESTLEQAIVNNLQQFLLELGKGFAFVARQKHISFGSDDFYIDLVFYNYLLKCFLLIDLKMGKLTHADIGQMDGYVRLYEDQFKVAGDNPTIGLLLCSDKSEAVAKYSILSESQQLFAAKYLPALPSEEQLRLQITKERRLIESAMAERRDQP